ncbi:hypothetical protein [Mycoplasma suis]|uniref:Uncharacterized protein n=2 Tax=Mycoplasma suis TaxID=57372 RepID=F0QQU0_MYCSL|nr:hypothetical protein [Mycoplasma suis]ADX97860.1 hypothetical protein MSU_0318 [Mycoplasma suis str. Illinois]CBZ40360.1 similar to transposase [Mycoplasma suis KI3806]
MALGNFLLPFVLVGGLASGGAASFLIKKEHEGDANTITIFKRTEDSYLGLGNPENQDLSKESSTIISLDKDGWKHNTNNQNGNSFRLTTGNQIRTLSNNEKMGWRNVLQESEIEDDGETNKSKKDKRDSEDRSGNQFHGDLTIYLGGATCQDISQKFSDLSYQHQKNGGKEDTFLPFFSKSVDMARFDEKNLSLIMWECHNSEDKKEYGEFLKELKEVFPQWGGTFNNLNFLLQ